jgi:hypothetical protein
VAWKNSVASVILARSQGGQGDIPQCSERRGEPQPAFLPVIKQIKSRTAMYVGQRSISCLRAFLNGWEFAHEGKVDGASLMHDFQKWVARKCKVKAAHSWDRIILFESQDEADALEKLIVWFDEFCSAQDKAAASKSRKPQRSTGQSRKPA